MDVVSSFSWIAWLGLILVLIVIEMLSLSLVFLMIALGGAGGLVAGLLGAPLWLQLVIAAVLALLLLFGIRPPLLRALGRSGDPAKSNVAALIGMPGTVVSTVTATGGLVKLKVGETWTARSVAGSPELVPGASVTVVSIDGATAVVAAAAPETTPEERWAP